MKFQSAAVYALAAIAMITGKSEARLGEGRRLDENAGTFSHTWPAPRPPFPHMDEMNSDELAGGYMHNGKYYYDGQAANSNYHPGGGFHHNGNSYPDGTYMDEMDDDELVGGDPCWPNGCQITPTRPRPKPKMDWRMFTVCKMANEPTAKCVAIASGQEIPWQFKDEMEDEEAGGFSVEAGYEKDGANVKVKWEQENKDEDVGSSGWGDDFGKPAHTQPHRPDGESLGKWINFRL